MGSAKVPTGLSCAGLFKCRPLAPPISADGPPVEVITLPFPDGQSALNLAAARLRHIAGTAWSTKRYLNIGLLKDQQMRGAITA